MITFGKHLMKLYNNYEPAMHQYRARDTRQAHSLEGDPKNIKGAARITALNVPAQKFGVALTFLDDLDAEPKTY